jgi:hypothetical protein
MLGEDVTAGTPESNHPGDAEQRTGVGMLSMQLKAALREAVEAEAAEAAIDPEVACREMRVRLTPLLDQRRAALAEALEDERRQADVSVAKARRAAEAMIAQVEAEERRRAEEFAAAAAASQLAAEEAARLAEEKAEDASFEPEPELGSEPELEVEPEVEPEPEFEVEPEPELEVEPELGPEPETAAEPEFAAEPELENLPAVEAPSVIDPIWAGTVPADDGGRASTGDDIAVVDRPRDGSVAPVPAAATAAPGPTTNVVVDAEAFARVFATVIAQVLAEREVPPAAWPAGAPVWVPAPPTPAPAEAKRSFWRHAWHADVVLLGIATVIVVAVLAAWLG